MKKNEGRSPDKKPSQLITERIKELGDWRGRALAHMRKLIKEADPDVVEEWNGAALFGSTTAASVPANRIRTM